MNAAVTAGLITLPVNFAASGDNTVRAAKAGKRWAVVDVFLQAEADVTLTVYSGAGAITGPIEFSTATTRERLWQSSGERPLWKAAATNQALVMNLGGAVQVNGWVNILEVDS